MSCENPKPVKWCTGPDGHGQKCVVCSAKALKASQSPKKATTKIKPPEVVLNAQPAANQFHVICYRGDTREPSQLANGFQLWIPNFTADMARDFILLYAGIKKNVSECSFAQMVEKGVVSMPGFKEALTKDKVFKQSPDDLMRGIIAEKSKTRPTVSTDLDPGCGGYDSANIYKIYVPGLRMVPWTTAIPALTTAKGLWPALYLNNTHLANSDVIALKNKMGVQELSFFNPIPYKWILEYQPPAVEVEQSK